MRRTLLPRALALVSALAGGAVPLTTGEARAADAKPVIVVVLKAGTAKGPIAPYEEAARGFREVLEPVAEVLITPEITAESRAFVEERKPDLLVAFGHEAALFAEKSFPAIPRVVALAPGIGAPLVGPSASRQAPHVVISPDIAADVQVRWIGDSLPDVHKVGVLYDPAVSQGRIDELVAAARQRGGRPSLEIVPIPVTSEGEVPAAFKNAVRTRAIEALLFIPDRLVITKGTISHLLKESLAAGIPAIGFNWYFVDNGAVLGFGLDYTAVGRQAAETAREMDGGTTSFVTAPDKVTIWVNRRVADKLRIRTAYDPDKVKEIR